MAVMRRQDNPADRPKVLNRGVMTAAAGHVAVLMTPRRRQSRAIWWWLLASAIIVAIAGYILFVGGGR